LRNHAHWRRLARQSSLARCLETVLDETHYADWLLTQPRGAQRHANVRRLVALAREFDQFQRQGLFRFLRFVEAQQEAETEPQVAAVSGDDAVRLMSIHQSKGLEFPVVAVADLAKPFNLSDLRAEIILDPELGLCPRIKPPQAGRRYPSLPYWMAAQRQKRDSLGEEMRLLYVAMTRARDTLILTGAVSEKQLETEADSPGLSVTKLLAARSYLDWIFLWLASAAEKPLTAVTGENQWLQWNLYEPLDARLRDDSADADGNAQSQKTAGEGDEKKLADLRARLAWEYPHPWAVKQAAKTSVTALRRQWAEQMAEAQPLASLQSLKFNPPSSHARDFGATRISAADKGTAHHVFLQWMNLELGGTGNLIGGLKAEAHRLQLAGLLTADETSQLDFEALAAFWNSDLGKKIREQRAFVKRELPFTARFSPEEISFAQANAEHLTLRLRDDTSAGQAALSPSDGAREISAGQGNLSATAMPASVAIRDVKPSADEPEFVVVQGVADLVVLLPREIWLVDFKTDRMTGADLPDKIKQYEPQLRLYALALARIYHRPVTGSWLHFLEIQRSQKIEIGQDARD
jgi:ATP-dependent helicase/nuclease subunit A